MMTAYLFIILLFCIPLALLFFTQTFYEAGTPVAELLTISSPLYAASQIPLYMDLVDDTKASGDWFFFIGYTAFSLLLNLGLLLSIIWLFNTRWRVAT